MTCFVPLSSLIAAILVIGTPMMVLGVDAQADIVLGQTASFTLGGWDIGDEYDSGILAAFREANNSGGVGGRNISLVSLDDHYDPANIPTNMATLMAMPDLFAFFGFTGSPTTAVAIPIATTNQIPLVAPLTGSLDFRATYYEYAIHVRAGYESEINAMLRLVLMELKLKRVSIIYQDDPFGRPAKIVGVDALESFGMSFVGVHSYNKADFGIENFTQRVEQVLANKPDIVIMFTVGGFSTPFLDAMVASVNPSDFPKFVFGSWYGAAVTSFLQAHPQFNPTSFFQVQVVPDPHGASVVAQNYRAALAAYDPAATPTHVSLEGYIAARFLVDALRRSPTPLTRAGFLATVYGSKMFEVDDVLMGPYSRDCVHDPGNAIGRSSLCRCGQGMRYLAMTQITAAFGVQHLSQVSYPITECTCPYQGVVDLPLVFYTLSPVEEPAHTLTQLPQARMTSGATAGHEATALGFEFPSKTVAGGSAGVETFLSGIQNQSVYTAAASFMESTNNAALSFPIATVPARPGGGAFQRKVVHLLPTLEQQLFAIATTYADPLFTQHQPVLISRTSFYSGIGFDAHSYFASSVATAGGSSASLQAASFTDSTSLATALLGKSAHAVTVVGLSGTAEVSALLLWLSANPSSIVCLPLNDVLLYWADLSAAAQSVRSRILFVQLRNLNWNGTSEFSTSFQTDVTDATNRSDPMVAVGYFLRTTIGSVVEKQKKYTEPNRFVDKLYSMSVISSGGITVGTFRDTACTGSSSGSDCRCNTGVRDVELHTVDNYLNGAFSGATHPLFPTESNEVYFATCYPRMLVAAQSSESDNTTVTIVGAVLGSFFGLAVIVGIVMEVLRRKNMRNVSDAPKKPPIALIFTDIQDSTKQWSSCPASMAASLDIHHRVIREAIRKHSAYEVKTVGDCFMIAAGSAKAAVELAVDTQRMLQKEQFPSSVQAIYEIDAEAGADELDLVVDDPEQLAPLDPVWNGLRVRIGIHVGAPEVRFDEVVKGYDYYGHDANLASRMEGVTKGGQICITRETANALPDMPGVEIQSVGTAELKGVGAPTEILQVTPIELRARKFASPQETGVANDAFEDGSTDGDSHSQASSIASSAHDSMSQVGGDQQLVAKELLTTLFKVLGKSERNHTITTLANAWRAVNHRNKKNPEKMLDGLSLRVTPPFMKALGLLGGKGEATQYLGYLTRRRSTLKSCHSMKSGAGSNLRADSVVASGGGSPYGFDHTQQQQQQQGDHQQQDESQKGQLKEPPMPGAVYSPLSPPDAGKK